MNTQYKKGQIPWNRGIIGKIKYPDRKRPIPMSEETKRKISLNGFHFGMKGKKHNAETKRKMSLSHKGELCHLWQGGITNLSAKIRNGFRYRQWISDIFQRDNYICQECSIRGGKLHAHHIKQFATILKENNIKTFEEAMECEELWNINNGQTLCYECHKNTETYLNKKVKILEETGRVSPIEIKETPTAPVPQMVGAGQQQVAIQ